MAGAFGVLAIIGGYSWWRKKRRLTLWCFLGRALIIAIWSGNWLTQYQYDHRPKLQVAQDIMKRPPGAVVISTDPGGYGDGTVTFTIPATKSVHNWMQLVWKLNSVRSTAGSTKNEWQGYQDAQDDYIVLSYDAASKTYTYRSMAN
jgi:hypothetical protein